MTKETQSCCETCCTEQASNCKSCCKEGFDDCCEACCDKCCEADTKPSEQKKACCQQEIESAQPCC